MVEAILPLPSSQASASFFPHSPLQVGLPNVTLERVNRNEICYSWARTTWHRKAATIWYFHFPQARASSWDNPVPIMKSRWALSKEQNAETLGPWMTCNLEPHPDCFRGEKQAALWPSPCVWSLLRFLTRVLDGVWFITTRLGKHKAEQGSFEHC